MKSIFLAFVYARPPLSLTVRVVRFLAVGVVGLLADIFTYTSLFNFFAIPIIDRGLSLIVATFFTWRFNRMLTFDATLCSPSVEAVKYASIALVSQGFNYALFLFLTGIWSGVAAPILIIFCSAVASFFSFLGQNFYTFRSAYDREILP